MEGKMKQIGPIGYLKRVFNYKLSFVHLLILFASCAFSYRVPDIFEGRALTTLIFTICFVISMGALHQFSLIVARVGKELEAEKKSQEKFRKNHRQ